jgi:hypothetical protein
MDSSDYFFAHRDPPSQARPIILTGSLTLRHFIMPQRLAEVDMVLSNFSGEAKRSVAETNTPCPVSVFFSPSQAWTALGP